MEKSSGYVGRAWRDLSSDASWWKTILVLGCLNCLPIIGQVLTMGYLYDWAKEGAWGMTRSLPRELGSISRRFKYGLYWLVNALVWGLPPYIVGCLLAMVPTAGPFLQVVCDVIAVIALLLAMVAGLRSAIYERVYPGLQVHRVVRMANADLFGLCRALCVILCTVVVLAIALLLILTPALPLANMIETSGTGVLHGTGLILLIALGLTSVVVGLVVWVAATICVTLVVALCLRCVGYWVGQFEPAVWGSPEEPMPFEVRQRHAGPVRPPRADGEQPEDAGPAAADDASDDAAAEGIAVEQDGAAEDGREGDSEDAEGAESTAGDGDATDAESGEGESREGAR